MSASNFITLSSQNFYAMAGSSSSWGTLTYTDWRAGMILPNGDATAVNTFVADNRFPTGEEPFSIVTQHVRVDGDTFNNPKLGNRQDLNVAGLPVEKSGIEVDATEVPFGVVVPPSSSSSSSRSSSSSSSQYIHYGYRRCVSSSSSSSKYLNWEYELCPPSSCSSSSSNSSSSNSFSSSSSSYSSGSNSSSCSSSSALYDLLATDYFSGSGDSSGAVGDSNWNGRWRTVSNTGMTLYISGSYLYSDQAVGAYAEIENKMATLVGNDDFTCDGQFRSSSGSGGADEYIQVEWQWSNGKTIAMRKDSARGLTIYIDGIAVNSQITTGGDFVLTRTPTNVNLQSQGTVACNEDMAVAAGTVLTGCFVRFNNGEATDIADAYLYYIIFRDGGGIVI